MGSALTTNGGFAHPLITSVDALQGELVEGPSTITWKALWATVPLDIATSGVYNSGTQP